MQSQGNSSVLLVACLLLVAAAVEARTLRNWPTGDQTSDNPWEQKFNKIATQVVAKVGDKVTQWSQHWDNKPEDQPDDSSNSGDKWSWHDAIKDKFADALHNWPQHDNKPSPSPKPQDHGDEGKPQQPDNDHHHGSDGWPQPGNGHHGGNPQQDGEQPQQPGQGGHGGASQHGDQGGSQDDGAGQDQGGDQIQDGGAGQDQNGDQTQDGGTGQDQGGDQAPTGGDAVSDSVLKGVLDLHNQYRARHGAPALSWSSSIAFTAQSYSRGCVMQHSHNQYGENLAKGHRTFDDAVRDWYSEESGYNYGSNDSGGAGHFTQIVWKSTTQLGCGYSSCNGSPLYVCNYSPPGNYGGQYSKNVSPPSN